MQDCEKIVFKSCYLSLYPLESLNHNLAHYMEIHVWTDIRMQ